jgi:ABC-type transporter Mla subunit MlaD
MASLKDVEQLVDDLEGLAKRLRSELQNGKVDFEQLIQIADEISEHADAAAGTFATVNETLMDRIKQVTGRASSAASRATAGAKS